MKEVEKLDLILRQLYDQPDKMGDPRALLEEKEIFIEVNDAFRLAKRLEECNLVERHYVFGTAITLRLRSEGVEFVEGTSFTLKDSPIINNNYTINGSTNANIIAHSNQVTIDQNSLAVVEHLLERIEERINAADSVNAQLRQIIQDSIKEIGRHLNLSSKPD